MTQASFDIDEMLESFHTWLEAQSKDELAAYAERLTDQVPQAAPLGMVIWPRAQPDDPVQTQALRVGLPLPIKSQITMTDWHPSSDAVPDPLPQAVLYTGDADELARLQQQSGQWPQQPVPIISCEEDIEDDFDIPLAQLQQ